MGGLKAGQEASVARVELENGGDPGPDGAETYRDTAGTGTPSAS